MFKKLGAEAILSIMIFPFIVWIITNIYELKSAYAAVNTKSEITQDDIQEIKSDVKFIRQYLLETKDKK